MRLRLVAALFAAFLAGCAGLTGGDGGDDFAKLKDSPPPDFDPSKILVPKLQTERITPSGNRSPYVVNGKEYEVLDWYKGFKQRGIASWYGQKFEGRPTSNGEIYDVYKLTAAHKELPLPLFLKVTNLANNKQIVVRLNDRGPFHDQRVIDLSYAAAYRLGFAEQGTAPVEIEVIDTDNTWYQSPPLVPQDYFVQLGAYLNQATALKLKDEIEASLPFPVIVTSSDTEPVIHRVRVGPYGNRTQATEIMKAISYLRQGQEVVLVTAPVGKTPESDN